VHSAAKSLRALIDGVLDLSRIEAGHMPTRSVDFELGALLAEVRGLVTAQARAKGLRLGVHITTRTPLALNGDKHHLHEILLNLAGNAVKFTDSGSVTLAVDASALSETRVRLRFEVSDTGVGIAADAVGRIFESFTQADATIMDRFGGTGLGLAICERLVGLLGGEIGVDSTLGQGSSFWFTLDMDTQVGVAASPLSLAGSRVTLLSADAAVADRLGELVRAAGGDFDVADGAARAIGAGPSQRIHAVDTRPRALILHRAGLTSDPEALASALQAVDPVGRMPLILIDEPAAPGLPPASTRQHFATVIPPALDERDIIAALRIAGLDPGQSPAVETRAVETRRSTRSLHILVADDNRTNQRVVGKVLERAGHTTTMVGNGEEALDALSIARFDLVLMDVNMPVMNGLEATKLFRFTELGQPHLPIIALTADITPEVAARCLEAGMDSCLTKPIEPAKLLQAIDDAVPAAPEPAETSSKSPLVTDIASHPRFRPAITLPSIDEGVLKELEALGGKEFLSEVSREFVHDADILVGTLAGAVENEDVPLFRDRAHALRSGAANIGAKALYDLCLQWRQIGNAELAENGARYIERLTAELDRVRSALEQYRAQGEQTESQN
jgi:two-component system sensor histidine kinase RpfC